MYLPLHNVSRKRYLFKFSMYHLGFYTTTPPLLAFFSCVLITMFKDFENANQTHCNVPNIFPSISASIGSYDPQITIWKIAIYLHAPSRFFVMYIRLQYYDNVIKDYCYIVVRLAVILDILENLALLGVTFWSSRDYYSYHEKSFEVFIGASILYMLITCIMLTKFRRRPYISNLERYSLKLKWRMFLINVGSFTFAAYFFLRHNSLCEPYVYSMFGLSEYIVVLSNMAFHFTTVYDLQIQQIYVTSKGISMERLASTSSNFENL